MKFGVPKVDERSMSVDVGGRMLDILAVSTCRAREIGPVTFVEIVEEGGQVHRALAVGGRARRSVAAALGRLGAVATLAWRRAVESALEKDGVFRHAGLEVHSGGRVVADGAVGNVALPGFRQEVDGGRLRLVFEGQSGDAVIDVDAGFARAAIALELARIRDRVGKSVATARADTDLRKQSRERFSRMVRSLACVFVRQDSARSVARLNEFLVKYDCRGDLDRAAFGASQKLLVSKGYLQKAFDEIDWHFRKIGRIGGPYDMFEDLVLLALADGALDSRRVFALYEFGLFLGHGIGTITQHIEDVVGPAAEGGDVSGRPEDEAAADWADWSRQSFDQAGDAENASSREQFEGDPAVAGEPVADSPKPVAFPPELMPLLAELGVSRVYDEKSLRRAWTARMRQCHPDTLPHGADEALRAGLTEMTARCNLAYAALSVHMRKLDS